MASPARPRRRPGRPRPRSPPRRRAVQPARRSPPGCPSMNATRDAAPLGPCAVVGRGRTPWPSRRRPRAPPRSGTSGDGAAPRVARISTARRARPRARRPASSATSHLVRAGARVRRGADLASPGRRTRGPDSASKRTVGSVAALAPRTASRSASPTSTTVAAPPLRAPSTSTACAGADRLARLGERRSTVPAAGATITRVAPVHRRRLPGRRAAIVGRRLRRPAAAPASPRCRRYSARARARSRSALSAPLAALREPARRSRARSSSASVCPARTGVALVHQRSARPSRRS